MIEATLTRIPQRTQTLGKLIVRQNNAVIFDCDTIELQWLNNQPQISCIPVGTYKVVYRESAKYPRHYHIQNVPDRSWILIHQANYVGSKNPNTRKADLLGCIGVGRGYADLNGDGIVELTRSNATLKQMLAVIGTNSFRLTIV